MTALDASWKHCSSDDWTRVPWSILPVPMGGWKAADDSPLRANKGSYYDGGMCVPLVVRWPDQAKAETTLVIPVTSTVLYPTCLDAAGFSVVHGDGIRLKPFLRGSVQIADRDLFRHFLHYRKHPQNYPSSVVRSGRGKLMTRRD